VRLCEAEGVQGGTRQDEAAQVIGSAVRTWLWIQDVYKRGILLSFDLLGFPLR
jgi:hypothetical protein